MKGMNNKLRCQRSLKNIITNRMGLRVQVIANNIKPVFTIINVEIYLLLKYSNNYLY